MRRLFPSCAAVFITLLGGTTSTVLAQCPPAIIAQPQTTRICIFPAGVGTLSVTATGTNLSYQWQQQDLGDTFPDFVDIHDGPIYDTVFGLYLQFTAAGTSTNQLTLSEAQGYAQIFRCVITSSCGRVESNEAYLLYCHADFDCSGTVSIDDIFVFLNAWFANDPTADFDFSDEVSIDDIFLYLNAWFAGCT